jgi:hypothetical protein
MEYNIVHIIYPWLKNQEKEVFFPESSSIKDISVTESIYADNYSSYSSFDTNQNYQLSSIKKLFREYKKNEEEDEDTEYNSEIGSRYSIELNFNEFEESSKFLKNQFFMDSDRDFFKNKN